jgi:hypothetical protein
MVHSFLSLVAFIIDNRGDPVCIGIQDIPGYSTVTLRVSNAQLPDQYTSVDIQWLCKCTIF